MIRPALLLCCLAACGGGSDDPDALVVDTAPSFDATRVDAAAPDAPIDAPTADAPPVVITSPMDFASGLAGTACGLGWDAAASQIWVIPCNGDTISAFTTAGVADGTLARPGETADDIDISFAPEAATIGVNAVLAGQMIVINGETGTAEVHLPETTASTPLATAFGAAHVVGGAYHAGRDSLFLVEDRNATNSIAELDRVTGAVLNSFSALPHIDVNYGDLEVCPATGNLFVVSSLSTNLVELTPTGDLVGSYPLPAELTTPSGLGLVGDGTAWVGSTSTQVYQIVGVPCGP